MRLTAAYHDLRDPKYHLIKSPFIGLSTIRSVSALQPSILNAVINGLSNILARCSYRLAMAACKSELKTLVEIHLVCHQLFLLCKMLTSLIDPCRGKKEPPYGGAVCLVQGDKGLQGVGVLSCPTTVT